MKRFLRLITILSVLCAVGSVVLLLNFTAPNPTGRRYSSEMPLNTGDTNDIGDDAERILANDLEYPNNNNPDQLQCLCSSQTNYTPSPNQCRVCVVHVELIGNFRVPDFVSASYMADSKNWQRRPLAYTDQRLQEQLTDFTTAALVLKIPFWLYVPVTAYVDPKLTTLIESTGGAVIPYFTVPGYIDPVDAAARVVLLVSFVVLAVAILGRWLTRSSKVTRVVTVSPKSPRSPRQPDDPASRAIRKTEAAEDFVARRKEKERRKLEMEDFRDDL